MSRRMERTAANDTDRPLTGERIGEYLQQLLRREGELLGPFCFEKPFGPKGMSFLIKYPFQLA